MSPRQWWRRVDRFVALTIALTAIPVVVAIVRAIVDGWIPLGDQALLQIRAHDVFTSHHPLLGTASSAALGPDAAVPLNHPGPLMFDVLALPVRIFGGPAGVAIGVGLVNIAAATVAVIFAARRAGRAGAALAAMAFVGLGWAAGSESLYDPNNPTAAMLPCLACLFLAMAAIERDGVALLWLIGVATFAVQLNNGYMLFLTPLVVSVCAIYIVRSRRDHMAVLRAVAVRGVTVFAVLWSQPLIEQLWHGRDGNMARMLKASGVLERNPGPRLGTQIAARTLTLPPWWGRSKFGGVGLFSPVPNLGAAALSLAFVLVVCSVGFRWAQQREYGDASAALLIAGIAILIGWVAAVRSPMSAFYGVGSDYVRWLWPASVFIWFALGLTAWRLLGPRLSTLTNQPVRLGAATVAIATISLANVPRHTSLGGQRGLESLRPSAVQLIDTAIARVDAATVLYRPPPNYDVFGVPLLARLQRTGVNFVVDDPVLVRQFGEGRRYKGEAVTELRLVTAMEAVDEASSPNAIAFASDLSVGERGELQTLAIEIEVWLLEGRITLSDSGEATVDAGFGDVWLRQLGSPELDATAVSRSNSLATAIQFGLLAADPQISTALVRFATLRLVAELSTVVVLIVPPI